ncbi:hypothetical protein HYC85_003625 [Camellia sinensis]|uniref:PGG domain-containing protein n=1 Tax=Camellia sinensis TaxID=4442 RepID=A0A7J7HU82_CAMSI|nr:hypothetical protein HYC85_003625 [Camellia sinensis]
MDSISITFMILNTIYNLVILDSILQSESKSIPTIPSKIPILISLITTTGKSIEFVKNLVDLMPVEALELTDCEGHTALNTAAWFGNTEAAKILVAKHSDLLYIRNKKDWLPLYRAAQSAHKDTLSYLLMVTKPDCKTKKPIENDLEHMAPFEDDSGVELLVRVIASGFYGEFGHHLWYIISYSFILHSLSNHSDYRPFTTCVTVTTRYVTGTDCDADDFCSHRYTGGYL